MKILHFIHWPNTGITRLVKSLIKCDDLENEYIIVLVTRTSDEFEEVKDKVIKIVSLGEQQNIFRKMKMLRNVCHEYVPEIIHTHSFMPTLMTVFMGCKEYKVVRTIHSIYPYFSSKRLIHKFKRGVEYISLRKNKVIMVCVDGTVKKSLPWSYPVKLLKVVENGVDTDEYNDKQQKESHSDVLRIIALGRLEPQKGFDLLIPALKIVKDNGIHFRVDIFGSGNQESLLTKIIHENNLEDCVFLRGYTKNPNALFTQYDWLISPSRYEGFGLSIVEAMLSGLPVITSQKGGVPDHLKDGDTAIIIKRLSYEGIASAVERAYKLDTEKKSIVIVEGKKYVLKHYNIRNTFSRYLDVYQELQGHSK